MVMWDDKEIAQADIITSDQVEEGSWINELPQYPDGGSA